MSLKILFWMNEVLGQTFSIEHQRPKLFSFGFQKVLAWGFARVEAPRLTCHQSHLKNRHQIDSSDDVSDDFVDFVGLVGLVDFMKFVDFVNFVNLVDFVDFCRFCRFCRMSILSI